MYGSGEELSASTRLAGWALSFLLAIAFSVPLLAIFMSEQPPPSQVTLGVPLDIIGFSPSVMALVVVIGTLPLLLTALGLNQLVVPAMLRGERGWRSMAAQAAVAWLASLIAIAVALTVLAIGLRFGWLNDTLRNFVGAGVLQLLRGDRPLVGTLLLGTLIPAVAWVVWLRIETAAWERRVREPRSPDDASASGIVLGLTRFVALAAGLSLVLLLLYVLDILPGTDRQPDPNVPLFVTAAFAFAALATGATALFVRERRKPGVTSGALGLELPLITALLFGVTLAFTLRQDVITVANGLFGPGETAVFDRATRLFPDLAPAYYLKGERLWFQVQAQAGEIDNDTSQLELARAQFDKAIEADPDFAPSYLARGKIRLDLGDREGALADATKLIELKPAHPAGYALRAGAYTELGHIDLAAADFARVQAPLPADTQAWDALFIRCVALDVGGRQFGAPGWPDEAIADCERSLELNRIHASTYDVLGLLYYDSGRYEEALELYDQFVELSEGNPRALRNRALVLLQLGRYEEARDDLDAALDASSQYAEALQQRAEVWLYLGETGRALDDAGRAVVLRSDDPNSYLTQALVAMYSGELSLALQSADELAALGTDEALVRNVRGYAYALAGDFMNALPELDRAVALAPESASAADSRSYTRYLAGDNQGALRDVDRALQLVEPYNRASRGEMLYHRALIREALGDSSGAEEDAREAKSLRPVPLIEEGIEELLARLGG
jgi:tetratricopeptide (TPR) repeat protein